MNKKSATKQHHTFAMQLVEIRDGLKAFYRSKWFGFIYFLFVTLLYFWPMVMHIGTYIPGGDSMFNAWVMARNQNCIMQQHCPKYTDANIYYPNKDTMLYSEVEISPSVVTLPLRLVTDNPIIPYNIVTIASFLMAGISMYLLAMHLSRGNKFFALLAGTVFEFGPIMLASTHHLQNLSIFCLPLIILSILKFIDTSKKRYLVGLLLSLLYIFFASWYQVIFALMAIALVMISLLIIKLGYFKKLLAVGAVVALACLIALPLASEYMRFSRENAATYTMEEKILHSTSVVDYVVPPFFTVTGQIYRLNPTAFPSFNADTLSYSGISLFILAIIGAVVLTIKRKQLEPRFKKLYAMFAGIGLLGFVTSLGPFLKVKGEYLYTVANQQVAIPLPFALVQKLVPALGFMRGIGRASVLVLFALCCLLAMSAVILAKTKIYQRRRLLVGAGIVLLLFIDLIPIIQVPLDPHPKAYSNGPPAVYKYVKDHPEIDDIIVLQAQDYPNVSFWFARTEVVLWAGYHNRNVFNGYSGYIPKTFESDYSDFVNLDADDPEQMKSIGLKYVIVDSELYKNKPEVLKNVPNILGDKPLYSDDRYSLYKL